MAEVIEMKTTRRWALAATLTLAATGPAAAQSAHEHQLEPPEQRATKALEPLMVEPGMCMMTTAAHAVASKPESPSQHDARTPPIRAMGSSRLAWQRARTDATRSAADPREPGTHGRGSAAHAAC